MKVVLYCLVEILRFLSGHIVDILVALGAVFIGAVVTWWVTHRYYIRAAKDLKDETTKTREHTNLIIRGLEDAGA